MHSAVEEVKIDPFDFFIDVGSLVLEGRVPGLSSRGYGEGVHCPPAQLGKCVAAAAARPVGELPAASAERDDFERKEKSPSSRFLTTRIVAR
ncbi:hypothetical protein IscW_ISCW006768 [Ixodes scapularis]|uniref:Uncharacterized protein n=1 Tax=Ixodes scapularis TaxID=6945 RepID=B7PNR4_IXOSC|nr:hypothetical protein IscW_ISCW006768 [Ixodes scapularis]|eukprot:XP_002435406.1 hypothetical protein IscW_ISCW006768 [Ixodes scapularis]